MGNADRTSPFRLARPLAGAGSLWIACAVAIALASELGRPSGIDLIHPTFSELIFTTLGARLVGVSMVMLSFASICIMFALIACLAPTGRLDRMLIGVWSGALVVAAIFPPTPVGTPAVWYDTLHRYAALVGFVCLPLAGIRLARRFRTHAWWRRSATVVRACSTVSLLGIAAFVSTFVPTGQPVWLIGARQYSGITERLALASNIALLATLAAAVFSASRRRQPASMWGSTPQATTG
ncbi:DUF998 domain-containing protein [Dactylosporangium sp. CA-233914]|uniref:DUF998 domain-containing protein n=1 Tax=Dactylosporangium sp. CA-233914 TaxID=3239934 RepID=UPI003D8BBC04